MRSFPPLATIQNCYVVNDLEAACRRMNRLYGIGPFVGGTLATLGNHVYRGQPAPPIELRGVFVQSGDLNVELVELVSNTPSAFHDMFADGAEGFHHVAMFSADYDRDRDRFVADGFAVASEFTTDFGATICYIDARAALGHMIEMYPESDIIRAMYAQTRREAETWRGGDLIVPWD